MYECVMKNEEHQLEEPKKTDKINSSSKNGLVDIEWRNTHVYLHYRECRLLGIILAVLFSQFVFTEKLWGDVQSVYTPPSPDPIYRCFVHLYMCVLDKPCRLILSFVIVFSLSQFSVGKRVAFET